MQSIQVRIIIQHANSKPLLGTAFDIDLKDEYNVDLLLKLIEKFFGNTVSCDYDQNKVEMRTEFAMEKKCEFEIPLETRITEFKDDPENMEVVASFVDDVLKVAEKEAEDKLRLQQDEPNKTSRTGSVLSSIKNGKVIVRARGMMLRIFDVICNCANSATVPTRGASQLKKSTKN